MRSGFVRPDEVATLEVVVNERGIVEAAWARISPRNVGESLVLATSLHAVKAWLFHPALKEGSPVAYRQLIALDGF